MPELPEVETLRRDLCATVVGRRITAVFLHVPEIVQAIAPERFVATLKGRRITDAERRAKYLLLDLDQGWVWVVHLMLEGQLLYEDQASPLSGDTKLVVRLDDGHELRLRDVVRLARTWLVPRTQLESALHLDALGPEPLTPEFTLAAFEARLEGRRAMIKPLLMDQKIIAGVGNLYADEALFQARIHPERKANTLSARERRALYGALIDVMRAGIAHRGASAKRGLYRDLFGEKGHHQDYLQVFRKKGQPCPGCSGTIEQIRVGGRATYVCPSCQRLEPVKTTH